MLKMQGIPIIFFLLLLLCYAGFGQERQEDFVLAAPDHKVQKSLYKTLKCIDMRPDTNNLGIVQVGGLNKPARLVPVPALSKQLNLLLENLNDTDAGNGELLLQIRRFTVSEITNSRSEIGECDFRAVLYSKIGRDYRGIKFLDTIITVRPSMGDVTKPLVKTTSKVISDFLESGLKSVGAEGTDCTLFYIMHIDSLEKLKIPVFTKTAFKDGLYMSFKSFSNQLPDAEAVVEIKEDRVVAVKMKKPGTTQAVDNQEVYVVVDHGRAFISTEFGYYALNKIRNELVFTGNAKVTTSAARMMLTGASFGRMGPDNASSTFEMKIDHLNGSFIKLKQIGGVNSFNRW